MSSSRQILGRWGEKIAEDFLDNKGFNIIERNYRTPYGEIDIIAQDGAILIFIEVKTRATNTYGTPEASITAHKREHIIASAQSYIQSLTTPPLNWRIDVIAIRKLKSNDQPEIIHFENAFS